MNQTSSRLHIYIYNNCRPFGIFGIQRFNELTYAFAKWTVVQNIRFPPKAHVLPERVREKFQVFIKNEASKKGPFKGNGDMKKQYFLLHATVISLYDLGALYIYFL